MPTFASVVHFTAKPMTRQGYAHQVGLEPDTLHDDDDGFLLTTKDSNFLCTGELWVDEATFQENFFQSSKLCFAAAVEHLKEGKRIKRARWSNCWVSFHSNVPQFHSEGFEPEDWSPAIEDTAAEDWEILL